MRKTYLIFLIILVSSTNIFAQLEVEDTLLLAFKNYIFWNSSSELEMGGYADYGKYGATNLGDTDPSTCWAEGSEGDGSNEFVRFTIPESTLTLRIRNGYQKSENIFYANNRLKNVEFELFASYEPSGYVTESHNGFFISEVLATSNTVLKDTLGYQDVKLNFNWEEINEEMSRGHTFEKDRFILKIKILDVYKGLKWNDACISDINVVPNPYFDLTPDEHGLIKFSANKTDTLFYNEEYVYQVVELSPDLEWIIFILMPSDIEDSRVDTDYKLYNTKEEKFIIPGDLTLLYGFIKKSGKMHIEGSDKDFNDKTILLKDL